MNPWTFSLLVWLATAVLVFLMWAFFRWLRKEVFRAMEEGAQEEWEELLGDRSTPRTDRPGKTGRGFAASD